MQRENSRSKVFTRRSLVLAGVQPALLGTLPARLYYLQVVQAGRYAVLADENRINLTLLAPPRGRIVDRFGVTLATNNQNYRVVLVAEQAGDIEATLDAINQLITLRESDRRRVLRDILRNHSFGPIVAPAQLAWNDVPRIATTAPHP